MAIVFVTLVLLVIIAMTSMNVNQIYIIVPSIQLAIISMVVILVLAIKVIFSMEKSAAISMNAVLIFTTVTRTLSVSILMVFMHVFVLMDSPVMVSIVRKMILHVTQIVVLMLIVKEVDGDVDAKPANHQYVNVMKVTKVIPLQNALILTNALMIHVVIMKSASTMMVVTCVNALQDINQTLMVNALISTNAPPKI